MFKKHHFLFFAVFFTVIFQVFSQEESATIKVQDSVVVNSNDFDALSPSRAAFYSAILPGLGQAYNKKYWKLPIVYGALGTSIYAYSYNNTNYKRVRKAYKLRINGKPDEFNGEDGNPNLSNDALVRAQKSYKKDKDLALLVTVGLYILQIVEASTNAHLLQHNVDNNLSFQPKLIKDINSNKSVVGASINFNF